MKYFLHGQYGSCRLRPKQIFVLAILWISVQYSSPVQSQNSFLSSYTYADSNFNFLEINAYASTQLRLPFWMQANQYGIVPGKSPAATIHSGLEHYWKIFAASEGAAWRLGGGVEVVSNFSPSPVAMLPQAFAKISSGKWEFFIGRRKQWVGLADSTIGMGSYVWSGNSLPIPKVQVGTAGYVSIPMTKDWIAFNVFYSEGFFEKGRPVTSNLKLHQKTFYLRLGTPTSHLKLYGGFNHQVQWGGKSPYQTIDGQMPRGLKSYYHVITGKPHATGNGLTHFDSTNRIGNHLGSIDLALELEFKKSSFFIYRQNIYEDGSLYYLNNIEDGLNGVRFRRKPLKRSVFQVTEVVAEFLYTKSQGGADANLNATIRGKDDYFNNAQVRDGWSYGGRTIGTPFITPTSETEWKWPNSANFFTSNNRLKVWNLALAGMVADHIRWIGKFSYSENFGTYNVPFVTVPKQYSLSLAMLMHLELLGGVVLKGSLAADAGDLYKTNFGVSLGLKKEDLFNIKGKPSK